MKHLEPRPEALTSANERHRCEWGVLAIHAIAFSVLNYPGQILVAPDIFRDGKYGPHFETVRHCEHGWPFTYLRRDYVSIDRPPYGRLSRWNLFEGVSQFNAFVLIANIVLGFVFALVGVFLLKQWRRRRFRSTVRGLLLFSGIVAGLAAVYVHHRSQYHYEQNILQAIDKTDFPFGYPHWNVNERTEWQRGGPDWLRHVIGEEPFRVFDRVVGIETQGLDELEHIARLKNLKVVRIHGTISNRQLQLLGQLPQLEALDMCYASLAVGDDSDFGEQYIRLPRLSKLRGLNLYGATFRGDALENIPSIEILNVTQTDIDDSSVPALISLGKLRLLVLHQTAITEAGVRDLRRGIPECEIAYSPCPPWWNSNDGAADGDTHD